MIISDGRQPSVQQWDVCTVWPQSNFSSSAKVLSLPQFLAIHPGNVSRHAGGDSVNEVQGKEERAGPEADQEACETIHNKAHLVDCFSGRQL